MPVAMAKLMPPPSTADPSACMTHMYNHCAMVTVLVGGWEELVGTTCAMVSGSSRQAPRGFRRYVLRLSLELAKVYQRKVRESSRTELPCHGSKDDGVISVVGSIRTRSSGKLTQVGTSFGRHLVKTSKQEWTQRSAG